MTPTAITVDALRALCEADGQRAAVMIAMSERGTQFVTWGKSAEDKVYALGLSDLLSAYLDCGPRLATYEDFVLDAARVKEERDSLLEALRERIKKCRCRGTGTYTRECTLCGDSTYDHYCDDEDRPCTDAGCVAARTAVAKAEGGDR